MITLYQLNLPKLSSDILQQCGDIPFNNIKTDSRQIQKDDVFVLLKSQASPSLDPKIQDYLDQVSDKAAFVLSEINPSDLCLSAISVIYVPNIREFLGDLVKESLQQKKTSLPKIIATTGTNGKTTITQLIAQLISTTATKTAILGTAGNGIVINGKAMLTPATHTTPDVVQLHHRIYDFAQEGVEMVAFEASSHGLHQQRLQGLPIHIGIFSNLSRDHLDYHHTMADYADSKTKLFGQLKPQYAIINLDDEFGALMTKTAKEQGALVLKYSLTDERADFFAKRIKPSLAGVDLVIMTPQGQMTVRSPLLGRFNVANLLAVIAAAMAYGMGIDEIKDAIPKLTGATGRMQKVASKTGCFIVDYAHTPDALTQVLTSLKEHCEGQLWAVFGCGGDRDKGKRPLMTKAALNVADRVVLTSDNPRSESPTAILSDMQVGLTAADHNKIHIEPDRKQAIGYALANMGSYDMMVVAGKGHEMYQEINGVRYDFDDVAVIKALLEQEGCNAHSDSTV